MNLSGSVSTELLKTMVTNTNIDPYVQFALTYVKEKRKNIHKQYERKYKKMVIMQ